MKSLIEETDLTQVTFSNLDKILYPKSGITKGRMIQYYIRAAPRMLPFLRDRILVMNRFPEGVNGESFYEKDAPVGTPPFVDTFVRYSPTADRKIHYIVCNNLDTLLWVANLASIENNITLSGTGSYETPDMVFFDIDPEPPATFAMATETALLVREYLHDLGLRPYVKTSGKKGIHIIIPIKSGRSFEETRNFVHQAGIEIAKERSFIVSEFSRSTEAGTVFIDYLQNAHGRTMICPYSLRATQEATVSTPIKWDELEQGVTPGDFTISTVIPGREDPWKGIFDHKQEI